MTVVTRTAKDIPLNARYLTSEEYFREDMQSLLGIMLENRKIDVVEDLDDSGELGGYTAAVYLRDVVRPIPGSTAKKIGAATVGTMLVAAAALPYIDDDVNYFEKDTKIKVDGHNVTQTQSVDINITEDPIDFEAVLDGYAKEFFNLSAKEKGVGNVTYRISPVDVDLNQNGENDIELNFDGLKLKSGYIDGWKANGTTVEQGELEGNATGKLTGTIVTDYGSQGNVTSNATLDLNNTKIKLVANANGTWDAVAEDQYLRDVTFENLTVKGKSKNLRLGGRLQWTEDSKGTVEYEGDIIFDKSEGISDLSGVRMKATLVPTGSKGKMIFNTTYSEEPTVMTQKTDLNPEITAASAIAGGSLLAYAIGKHRGDVKRNEIEEVKARRLLKVFDKAANKIDTYRWRTKVDLEEEDKIKSIDMVLEKGQLPKWLESDLGDERYRAPTVALVREIYSSKDYMEGSRPDMDEKEYRSRLITVIKDKFKKAIDVANPLKVETRTPIIGEPEETFDVKSEWVEA